MKGCIALSLKILLKILSAIIVDINAVMGKCSVALGGAQSLGLVYYSYVRE